MCIEIPNSNSWAIIGWPNAFNQSSDENTVSSLLDASRAHQLLKEHTGT
jgi:hypothetical protein